VSLREVGGGRDAAGGGGWLRSLGGAVQEGAFPPAAAGFESAAGGDACGDLLPTLPVELGEVGGVLGDGAREAGARADLIPFDTHGVGYVRIDGEAGMLRVRACWVSDADIDALTLDYWPPRNITVRRLDRPDDDGSGVGHDHLRTAVTAGGSGSNEFTTPGRLPSTFAPCLALAQGGRCRQ
jgi:hypothetical protein